MPTEWAEDYIDEKVGEADVSTDTFNAEKYLSKSMIEAGYGEVNIIVNSAFNYIIYSSVAALIIVLIFLRLFFFKAEKVKKCLIKVWRTIFWNMILRVLIETCMEQSVTNLIRMYSINDETWFETSTSTLAIGWLSVLGLLSIIIPVLLTKNKSKVDSVEFKAKYGSIMQGLNMKKPMSRYVYTFYILRRILIGAILVFTVRYPWSQMQVICFSCSLQLIYIGHYMPYEFAWMNLLEIINELCVLVCSYFIFVFSDGLLQKQSPFHPSIDVY